MKPVRGIVYCPERFVVLVVWVEQFQPFHHFDQTKRHYHDQAISLCRHHSVGRISALPGAAHGDVTIIGFECLAETGSWYHSATTIRASVMA